MAEQSMKPLREPAEDPGENFLNLAIGLASISIPIIGPVLGLVTAVGSENAKRKQKWAADVSSAVNEIRERFGRLPEALGEDPRFVDALYRATALALANRSEATREALRRALIMIGSNQLDEENFDSLVLTTMDTLVPIHFEVLLFLERNQVSIETCPNLEEVYNLYKEEGSLGRDQFRTVLGDLAAKQLVSMGDRPDYKEFQGSSFSAWPSDHDPQPVRIRLLGNQILSCLRDTSDK